MTELISRMEKYLVSVDYVMLWEKLCKKALIYNLDARGRAVMGGSRQEKPQIEVYALQFGVQVSSEDIIREMDNLDLVPGKFFDLVSLVGQYPNVHDRWFNDIVALGSTLPGERWPVVPYLHYIEAETHTGQWEERVIGFTGMKVSWVRPWIFTARHK